MQQLQDVLNQRVQVSHVRTSKELPNENQR